MSNRFRVYEKYSKETFKMEDDYTFRANDGKLIYTLTEAFQSPRYMTVEENTGFQDMRNMDIFEGDAVRFNVAGDRHMKNGTIVRLKSGAWAVMSEDGSEHLMGDVFCDVKRREGK